ncbi:26S proteasome non-ATPase regulatory subunit 4 [Choanephora cucurbitarum]|uniref:26S proteasome non-ATPase regulatory subunit 4 n=1 Tax=Choanephora cucurbitarum TaxID=101091 RepID=A0A1C7NS47_9FUNG|nr:26S proteasome non-ATPase regulatory subunit 4 [Choanephora cucurbitarum]
MVMEASMIVVDNSEWMRNGDYSPTRLVAQNEAVNLIFSSKTQSNPENTVGLMTAAGKGPEVLVTLTTDVGKILSALHGVKAGGKPHFLTSVQIAQLALKHRQNRNQRQRIIVFVASPIETDEKTLVKLAKKLKKNNVAVDVINFGQEAENTSLLEAFINNVNNSDNSHLVTIPPGPHLLSDMLISTPIVAGEDGAAGHFGGSGGGDFEFGIDPSLDPELALALRISLEEEKARQEAEAAKNGGNTKEGESSSSGAQAAPMTVDNHEDEEDDSELQAALAMSMNDANHDEDEQMEDLDEDDALQRALAMSMKDNQQGEDEEMTSDILGSLPGVDKNDERVQKALEDMKKKKEDQ